MSRSSAPSGATRARARSSTGCRSAPTSSCASRAATMPATRWSSAARPSSSACCPPASCARASSSIIGNGVVVDPWALLERDRDAARRRASRSRRDNLQMAENAPLILPLHGQLDRLREEARGAAQDRHHRARHRPGLRGQGRRAAPSASATSAIPATLRRAVDRPAAAPQRAAAAAWARRRSTAPRCWPSCSRSRRSCCPMSAASGSCSTEARRRGDRILFEGAQGALLDIDHGTYPYVTSSNTAAGQAATGSGLGRRRHRLCARHHQGLHHAGRRAARSRPSSTTRSASRLGERGHEFGTVTGRPRRCGWFDAVLVRQAVKVGGIDGIALTKLDVLDGFESSRSASATSSTASVSTTCRPPMAAQAAPGRSTRPWRAGRNRPAAPAPGPSCRPPRSSTSAASRS